MNFDELENYWLHFERLETDSDKLNYIFSRFGETIADILRKDCDYASEIKELRCDFIGDDEQVVNTELKLMSGLKQ